MNTRYSFFRLPSLHRQNPSSKSRSSNIQLTFAGILILGSFSSNGYSAKIVSQKNLATLVNVADLQKGKLEPFYKLETQAGSRKMPGAIVTKNPHVAAAKFVMSRRDLPKNIRQTAQTVADQIIRRAR